jgi:hypothetical protein
MTLGRPLTHYNRGITTDGRNGIFDVMYRTGRPKYAAAAGILPRSAVNGLRTAFENRTSMRTSFQTGPVAGLRASEMQEG